MILPAQTIRKLSILSPCIERTEFGGVTGGLSAAGYDLRLADDIERGSRFRSTVSMHDGNGSIRIARGTGIAQVVFYRLEEPTEQPYPADGKYQDQRSNTDAIFVGRPK